MQVPLEYYLPGQQQRIDAKYCFTTVRYFFVGWVSVATEWFRGQGGGNPGDNGGVLVATNDRQCCNIGRYVHELFVLLLLIRTSLYRRVYITHCLH